MIATEKPLLKSRIPQTIFELAVTTICGAAAGLTAMLILLTILPEPNWGMRDFGVYWATGQQFAKHLNPYDPGGLLLVERAAGLSRDVDVLFMRNPPTALLLVLPLGLVSLRAASFLWPLLLLSVFLSSAYLLYRMHGSPKGRRHLLAYSFGPALICIVNGQSTVFALLGLVLFLRLHRTSPYVAGICFWLCSVKPHLFLPFGIVLLTWTFVTHAYRLVAGIGTAAVANAAIVLYLDPLAFAQYSQMFRTSGIEQDFIPCASYLLRIWIRPQVPWISFLPGAIACAWALRYYWIHRREWDWTKHGSLLMLVSILAAPYSWLYDQVLAIPALLQGAYVSRSRNLVILLALLSALPEVALFCCKEHGSFYLWTLWTAPVWLLWYVAAQNSDSESRAAISRKIHAWFGKKFSTELTHVTPGYEPTERATETPAYPQA
jgi:hypothetical protein